jgi:hypothetical protein
MGLEILGAAATKVVPLPLPNGKGRAGQALSRAGFDCQGPHIVLGSEMDLPRNETFAPNKSTCTCGSRGFGIRLVSESAVKIVFQIDSLSISLMLS